MRRRLAIISIAAAVLLSGFRAYTATERTHEFLWLSDIHFDPTANPELTGKLAAAGVEDWAKILDSSPGTPSKFGQDTDWPLLRSLGEAVRNRSADAHFTVVTGDLFVHSFRKKFDAAAANHDDQAFRDFAAKTFQFVAAQLESMTPGKPVLFTLGNNDDECGDYELQPYGPFLKDTSAAVRTMLGPVGDKASEVDWSDAGNYDVRNPSLENGRVIALNSIFFSANYQNACGSDGDSYAAKDQMEWLASRLAAAKERNEKVWLLFHIPPGIDGYATAHSKEAAGKTIVPMWKPEYSEQFETLLKQYPETVSISLAGHEHMDDFRVIDHSLILVAPGLSPLFGQSPAFRVVKFASDGALTDATTYYLSNLAQFDNGQTAQWKPEYSEARAWRMKKLDYASFNKLDHEIETEAKARERWMNFFDVSHPGGGITNETFPWLFCAAANVTEAPYQACVERLQKSAQ